MDRIRAKTAFKAYGEKYNIENINIRLKIDHTYRVAQFCERISKSLTENASDIELAWLLGLLHDIGRFEQLKRYNTFVDKDSIDHADLGADILFSNSLIYEFIDEQEVFPLIEAAIRFHNKLKVPEDLDENTLAFTNILRDADKCDIFRVICEPPFNGRARAILASPEPARDLVMNCIKEHRCVPRTFTTTPFESLLSQCCLAFELVFEESRGIVKEQGYLNRLMNIHLMSPLREQMDFLREELREYI